MLLQSNHLLLFRHSAFMKPVKRVLYASFFMAVAFLPCPGLFSQFVPPSRATLLLLLSKCDNHSNVLQKDLVHILACRCVAMDFRGHGDTYTKDDIDLSSATLAECAVTCNIFFFLQLFSIPSTRFLISVMLQL